ncbi:MAG: glycosyltransferase family 4 protein [Candidatus Latescibacterota bacterium]
MRILFLSQWFEPEPCLKGLSLAKKLQESGHEVEVLTGFPNYPGGKIYPGYRIRFSQRELMDGILVTRIPMYPSHNLSGVRRMFNYASFALSAATIGLAMAKRADIVYIYDMSASIILPACCFKWLRRMPFVVDIQDLWPDTLSASGMIQNRFITGLAGALCRFGYRQAAGIVVLSPGFKKKLIERGVPEDKVEVIYNWCIENEISAAPADPRVRERFGMSGGFNVVFAGNMGKAQVLDAVLDAAERVFPDFPLCRFVFVGGGVEVENLRRSAEARRLTNVLFLPRQPVSEIDKILNCADALLIHLKDDPLFRITIPSKTQAYLAVGKPIIIGVNGDAADLVRQAGAGIVCTPENPEEIAAAVLHLAGLPENARTRLGEKGRDFYRRALSMDIGVGKMLRVFERALDRRRKKAFAAAPANSKG